MKIFSVDQIRRWDSYTIEHEPITSIDLMERAALAFVEWLLRTGVVETHHDVSIVCGLGNNGGDGLAIARLLKQAGYLPKVYIIRHSDRSSADFETNLGRYEHLDAVHWVTQSDDLHFSSSGIVIDALMGSGLSRGLSGLLAEVVHKINASQSEVISVDIASGLFADQANAEGDVIIRPTYTVSFQVPKLAFLQPGNVQYVGKWQTVDIGLHAVYAEQTATNWFYTNALALPTLPERSGFANKGNFGHALVIAGSLGKIGAAVLASRSCLRSGVGLLTVQVPRCGYEIMQTSVPEAMCLVDQDSDEITTAQDWSKYSAIGIGPGLGKSDKTRTFMRHFLSQTQKIPCVFDADALNILSEERDLLNQLPEKTILTPHPKEFERLLGKPWKNDYEKLELLRQFCEKHQVTVVLKGQHTVVATPDNQFHFNSTGNPGMATGGTGDVLTGVITALLAQQLEPKKAAILSVYRHGEAGDRAAAKYGPVALKAGDVAELLRW